MKNIKGLSLIELIIVMAIIAFGTVSVAPNIGAWISNYRLRTATRDVVSTFRTAQIRAVSTNTIHGVAFDAGSIQLYRSSGGLLVPDGSSVTLPTGIQFNSNTFPVNGTLNKPFAQFNANSTSSSGGVILRNSKGSVKMITVASTTGRIKVAY
jgi:prepilin-type N-terminal cleavage/methylation domain-containing protein